MNNFKAILFDVDGTLLDTQEMVYQSFKFTLEKHNFKPPTRDQVNKIMGTSLPRCYEILAPTGDNDKLRATHKQFQLENSNLAKLFPETLKVLNTLKKKKILLGAVTNRSNAVYKSLEHTKILPFFDVIITAEDVQNPKPHSEPLHKAINKLKLKKEEVLYIGDTEIDIQTGKNAKVKTGGLTNSFIGEKMKDFDPDYLLKDLSDLLKVI